MFLPHPRPGTMTGLSRTALPQPVAPCSPAEVRERSMPFELGPARGEKFPSSCRVWVLPQQHGHSRNLPIQPQRMPRLSVRVRSKAIRPIPIRVVSVGRSRSGAVQALVKEFSEKIRRYCPFEDLQVRSNPKNSSDVRVQVESEAERVLKVLHPDDWVVLLDERGKDLSSEDFAALVEACAGQSSKALVLCIGGPYGHGPQMKERCNSTVRLSKMVLNHDIALLVLLEQLYRAWTIIREEKYHH